MQRLWVLGYYSLAYIALGYWDLTLVIVPLVVVPLVTVPRACNPSTAGITNGHSDFIIYRHIADNHNVRIIQEKSMQSSQKGKIAIKFNNNIFFPVLLNIFF